MPKIRAIDDEHVVFSCPGCGMEHMIRVAGELRPRWLWNNSADAPTFSPSVLVKGIRPLTDEQLQAYDQGDPLPDPVPLVCHSFVGDGRIQFLSDCTHELAGQTVDLPEMADDFYDEVKP